MAEQETKQAHTKRFDIYIHLDHITVYYLLYIQTHSTSSS